jgi:hypothetical protein
MDDSKPSDALPGKPDGSVDYAAMARRLLEFGSGPRPRGRPRKSSWEEFEDHVEILKDAAKARVVLDIIRARRGLPLRRATGWEIASILKGAVSSAHPPCPLLLPSLPNRCIAAAHGENGEVEEVDEPSRIGRRHGKAVPVITQQ